MIHPKSLMWTGVLGVVLFAVAVYIGDSRKPVLEAPAPGPLVDGLHAKLNDVSGLKVAGASGRELVHLRRQGDQWVVVQRDGYPADVDKLRSFLLKLADARRIEAKTSRKESHAALGVEDISDSNARGLQVVLEGVNPEVSLIFGRSASQGTGTFVRESGNDQSWMIDQNMAVDSAVSNWLQRDLLDLAGNRIASLDIAAPKAKSLQMIPVASSGIAQFQLRDMPRNRELASDLVVDSTVGAVSGLRFDDVASVSASPAADADAVTIVTVVTREGLQVRARLWDVDGLVWSAWEVSLDADQLAAWVQAEQKREVDAYQARQVAKPDDAAPSVDNGGADAVTQAADEPQPLALMDPEGDAAQRRSAIEKEQQRLHARFEGRVFQLPLFKADLLRKSLEAYLKPKA